MNLIPDDTNIEKTRKQVLEASLKGTAKFLNSYNAFEYVYECDLQAGLYNSIKSSLENCKWNHSEKEWVVFSKKRPTTNRPCLVHCEQRYKSSDKGNRIDIAVWDPTEENAIKSYWHKDLLLLIEIKHRITARWAIEAVKEDYDKLEELLTPKGNEYTKGLSLTFTVADTASIETEFKKNRKLPDRCAPFNGWETLEKNGIQALIACRDDRDNIVEVTFK